MRQRRFRACVGGRARVAAVALALVATAPAWAQEGTGFEPMPKFTPDIGTLRATPVTSNARREIFDLLDSNGDGVIERAEWRDRKMLIFYVRDTDRDLQLTPAELAGIPIDVLIAADLNADGQLSGFEFNQAKFTDFEAVDLDHDGVVTFEEFSRALDALQHPPEPPHRPATDAADTPAVPGDADVDRGFGPIYAK